MKYWVYKDSRILGPFDKNDVAGLPGLDASTLVSAGESAAAGAGDWLPAGDIADLAALPLDRGAAWTPDDPVSTFGVLDKLQLDAAGLIGDDEFPGAAEDLFQDADMKRTFGDLLAPRPNVDEGELRRAKDRATELTVQLELLYKRVAELEAGQTNLVHRLAEKELQLRTHAGAPPPPDVESLRREIAGSAVPPPAQAFAPAPAPAPAASAPAPQPAPAAPARAPGVPPPSAAAPSEWPTAAPTGAFPSFPSLWSPDAPPAAAPAAAAPFAPPLPEPEPAPFVPPEPGPPIAADWTSAPLPPMPPMPVMPSAAAAPPATPPAPAVEPPPKRAGFEKKTFKIVPTVKAFRVVGPEDGSAAQPAPAPEAAAPAAAPAPAPAPAAYDWSAAAAPPAEPAPEATPEPAMMTPPPTIALKLKPKPLEPLPTPEPVSTPVPEIEEIAVAPAMEAITQEAASPAPPPPVTLSFGAPAQPPLEGANAPMPSFTNPGRSFTGGSGGAASSPPPSTDAPSMPPSTAVFRSDDMAGAPTSQAALARLAKPAPAPPTEAPSKPRSNKGFLIGAGVLVVIMAVVGALFLRHPKDLKQMTDLDDGRARLGAEPTDDASRPPLVKPKMAAPPADVTAPAAPQAPAAPPVEATQAASQAKLDAAVAAVKDFPLDGERGTVAQWLQFSYSATQDAGKESWNASETADKTYLVEYRFAPAHGGEDVHYLFEVDMEQGFVIGKNLDAKSVLAGGPRPGTEVAKPKAKPRKAVKKPARRPAKRTADDITPKDVPLLPLPNEGELRPPAEDDGAFNADTVNSGL